MGTRVLRTCDLVRDVGELAQYGEAVGEAGRDPEHPTVVVGQRLADPTPVGRRTGANVDSDIEDRATGDRYELSLGPRVTLVVESAQDAS